MIEKSSKVILILFLLIAFNSTAQNELELYSKKYPESPFVCVKKLENLTIKIKGCKLDIQSEHYIEKISLLDINQNLSDEYIHYSSFNEISDIEAYYLEPKGNKYQKNKIQNIVTASSSDNTVFYDDFLHKRIVFPNMHKGFKSVLSYKEKIKDPHLTGVYMFTGFLPVEYSEFTVTFPKEVELSYKILNDESKIVKICETKTKSETKLSFTVEGYKPPYSLNNSFKSSYFLPHVIIFINSYSACGNYTPVLENTASLYNWYSSLTKEINHVKPEVKNLSDSITNRIDNSMEKAKALFYWVQDNIKYVAFEDGYEGFIPRSAEKVMIRKYGDCKDMANLTTQLLKAAGINAYLSWVGTRSIPYSYHEIPSAVTDNHMICTAEIDGKYYFLDATDYLAFDFPSEFILSKEVMIGKEENKYEIVKVPVVSYERNTINESLKLSINNHTLKGQGAVELSGYYAFDMTTKTIYSNKENEKKTMLGYLAKGSDKFNLDNYNLVNFDNRDKNNIIEYSFSVPDYVKKFNDKLYVNLNLSTPYSKMDIDRESKLYAMFVERNSRIVIKNTLEIPAGYTVTYIPDPADFENNQFGFKANYSLENGNITYNFEMFIKTLKIEPAEFENWNKLIKALNMSYKKSIELTKIN